MRFYGAPREPCGDPRAQFRTTVRAPQARVGADLNSMTLSILRGSCDSYFFYASAKPALCGLWQVSGRSYDRRLSLDEEYVRSWNIALDIQILWRTARGGMGPKGAVENYRGHPKARVCAAFNSMTLSILRGVVDACTLRHCNGCDNTEVVSLSRKGNVTLGVLDI